MTLKKELFDAILAMDSYSRGYNADIKFGDGSGDYSLDTPGIQIGEATIYRAAGDGSAQDRECEALHGN